MHVNTHHLDPLVPKGCADSGGAFLSNGKGPEFIGKVIAVLHSDLSSMRSRALSFTADAR